MKYSTEVPVEDGTASVDIAFGFGSAARGDFKVAIEVDGPSHYTINTLQHTGPTRMRDHVIRAEGWIVVNIPFFEYQPDMPGSEKYKYIRRKLEEVDCVIHSDSFEAAVAVAEREEKKRQPKGGEAMSEGSLTGVEAGLKPRPAWQAPSKKPRRR